MTVSVLSSSRLLLAQQGIIKILVGRAISTSCEPARRLRDAIMDYRNHNYTDEVPTRFKKELLHPYTGSNGSVQVEQLNKLLVNIGYSDVCLTPQEQNELLAATGCKGREITMAKMMELID